MASTNITNETSAYAGGGGIKIPAWGLNFDELKRCFFVMAEPEPQDGQTYCPATFDDWLCWNYTLAGTTAEQQCPYEFIDVFNPKAKAFKECMPNGVWYVNPASNQTWSNYEGCSTEMSRAVLYMSIFGYSISCLLLIISLVIFNSYRQLRCPRVILHQHLFVSFILTGIMWIMTYSQVMIWPDIRIRNPTWCKVTHTITQYASVCNYFWMFCEGFFLHTVVVQGFAKQKKLLIACYIIGWGLPLQLIIAYVISRATDSDNDVMCWYHPSWSLWILSSVIMASLVINFVLLLNILRILLSKIRAFNNPEQTQNRRAVKAVLILIPLLGLQNMLTAVKPPLDKQGRFYWDLVSAVLVSFQGAAVALIFCFFNGEVLTVLKRRFGMWKHRYDPSFASRPSNNYSTTMGVTLDDSCVANEPAVYRNGRGHAGQVKDSTELQLMVPENNGEKEVHFYA